MLNCYLLKRILTLFTLDFNTGFKVVMVTWDVKELLLFKKWKNTKFNNSILPKIEIHHCLPFVDEQRSVNCLLFSFLPRLSPASYPSHPQIFSRPTSKAREKRHGDEVAPLRVSCSLPLGQKKSERTAATQTYYSPPFNLLTRLRRLVCWGGVREN